MAKNTAVFGIYQNRSMVESAVDTLVNAGYRPADISVLLQDNVGTKEFAHEKNTRLLKAPRPAPVQVRSSGAPWVSWPV